MSTWVICFEHGTQYQRCEECTEQQARIDCIICKQTYTISLTLAQVLELSLPNRRYIQEILHDKPTKIRELCLSQICPACWDKVFEGNKHE